MIRQHNSCYKMPFPCPPFLRNILIVWKKIFLADCLYWCPSLNNACFGTGDTEGHVHYILLQLPTKIMIDFLLSSLYSVKQTQSFVICLSG